MRPSKHIVFLFIALATFLLVNGVLFWTSLYAHVTAPDSTSANFDAGLKRVDGASQAPRRDVLVLGDSRIFGGLYAPAADAAAHGMHFINAGIPGTTPRCWDVFDRVLDPHASRFRAVVIPVDTFADDDSAIGSVDGDDHATDLHYVVFETNVADAVRIAASFPTLSGRLDALTALLLRGPLLREDVQAFVADPGARIAALRDPTRQQPVTRDGSLAGLRVDFVHDRVTAPPGFPAELDADLSRQVVYRGVPSPSYARYRREWIAPIVARYRERGVPVIFVRIPTRPLHRRLPNAPSGSLAEIGATLGAVLLEQRPYVALERPELFVDGDHLNTQGARRFSAMLGRDVAAAVDSAPEAFRHADARAVALAGFGTGTLGHIGFGTPMRFQSVEFFVFLAIVAAFFYGSRNHGVRRAVLLLASWYFYARWNAWYLAVLLGLTATDFVFGLLVERFEGNRRRVVLALGIAANLAFLGTAKYADFFTGSIARVFGIASDPWALHVLVPIGISFHTFQSMSYLVDVSRGRFRAIRDPFDYALYLAFFPQLLAGPIVRAERFFREWWRKRGTTRFSSRDLTIGCTRIAIGLFKKTVVADRFADVANAYFSAPGSHPGALTAWSAAFAFAMQIYFDFSGYSDIAIGSARVLGFHFPPNFHRPYLAWSVSEFWRRWHMTLSYWLRDYLYIPLGGNRGNPNATVRNLMLTMLLGGLWHGANWTFVAWGAYHGALLSIERTFAIAAFSEDRRKHATWRAGTTAATFALVVVGWVLFRAQTFGDAGTILAAMTSREMGTSAVDLPLVLLACVMLGIEILDEAGRLHLWRFPLAMRASALGMLAVVLEIGSFTGGAAPFIYFRF